VKIKQYGKPVAAAKSEDMLIEQLAVADVAVRGIPQRVLGNSRDSPTTEIMNSIAFEGEIYFLL
jgi:hypothetical protein